MSEDQARALLLDFEEACLDYAKWRNEEDETRRARLADQLIRALTKQSNSEA